MTNEWSVFLDEWEEEVMETIQRAISTGKILKGTFEKAVVARGGVSFPHASDEEIHQAERRLGFTFPLSFRSFLKQTNGWFQLGMWKGDGRILSASEITQTYCEVSPEMCDFYRNVEFEDAPDELYFKYHDAKLTLEHRRYSYLPNLVAISCKEVGSDELYFINPSVRFSNNEMEIWKLTHEYGAMRFLSFMDLMKYERMELVAALKEWAEDDEEIPKIAVSNRQSKFTETCKLVYQFIREFFRG